MRYELKSDDCERHGSLCGWHRLASLSAGYKSAGGSNFEKLCERLDAWLRTSTRRQAGQLVASVVRSSNDKPTEGPGGQLEARPYRHVARPTDNQEVLHEESDGHLAQSTAGEDSRLRSIGKNHQTIHLTLNVVNVDRPACEGIPMPHCSSSPGILIVTNPIRFRKRRRVSPTQKPPFSTKSRWIHSVLYRRANALDRKSI